MKCCYCGENDVPQERAELGYLHCTNDKCVAVWRRERLEKGYALHLLPKQGFAIVPKDMVVTGKSSGR